MKVFCILLFLMIPVFAQDNVMVQEIDLKKPLNTFSINSKKLGINILYWINDDSALSNNSYSHMVKDLDIKAIRFPGGEVADNYRWDINDLEDTNVYPKQSKNINNNKKTDYIELLKFAQKHSIKDIYFVVNVKGIFREGFSESSINKYADYAAKWVKEVKNNGFFVPYWEIGNELYFNKKINPENYTKILEIYSKKMKAIDSRIRIGAVGPNIILNNNEKLKKADENILNHQNWWAVLAQNCAACFDFAAIHFYKDTINNNRNYIKDIALTLEKTFNKNIPIAITEWNSPAQINNENTQILNVANFYLQGLKENSVQDMIYWPVNYNGAFYQKSLLDNNNKPFKSYVTLLFINNFLLSDVLKIYGENIFYSNNEHRHSFIFINKSSSYKIIKIKAKLKCLYIKDIENKLNKSKPCSYLNNEIQVFLLPKSITGLVAEDI